MSIINNAVPERDFTRVPNGWLRDRALSWRAKGLLSYIASHAASHGLTVEQMINDSSDGRDAVRATVRELEAHQYLRRVPVRERGRIVRYDYELSDPTVAWEAAAGPTGDGFTGDGLTVAGSAGDGFPGASRDQGKRGESAGGTGSWDAVAGETPTKKTTSSSEEKKTEKTKPSTSSRGTRIPDDWAPTTELGAWLLSKLPEGRWSDHSRRWVLHETEKFTLYWKSATGARATKKRWDMAWQGWMLKALERYRPIVAGVAPTSGAPAGQFKTAAEKNAEAQARRTKIYKLVDDLMDAGMGPDDALAAATAEVDKRDREAIGMDPCTVTSYIDGSSVDRETRREVTS